MMLFLHVQFCPSCPRPFSVFRCVPILRWIPLHSGPFVSPPNEKKLVKIWWVWSNFDQTLGSSFLLFQHKVRCTKINWIPRFGICISLGSKVISPFETRKGQFHPRQPCGLEFLICENEADTWGSNYCFSKIPKGFQENSAFWSLFGTQCKTKTDTEKISYMRPRQRVGTLMRLLWIWESCLSLVWVGVL